MAAIHNDTDFLSSQAVMDYSLLVGLDATTKELVLGIIGKSSSSFHVNYLLYWSNQLCKPWFLQKIYFNFNY